MTDAQYIEIGMAVVALSHRASISCENGDYFISAPDRIYISQDTALAFLREMGWTVETKHDGIIRTKDD